MTNNQTIKQSQKGNHLNKEDEFDSDINDIPTEYFDLARIFALVVVENHFNNISN